ncbi:MAG: YbaK/EbsC family protein [Anaerolineae bacterium]|nr:YbaK/EbsC family protein [Anaerolineae bacterium]
MSVPGYDENLRLLQESGVSFAIHEHEPYTNHQEMGDKLPFPIEALLKTIAFRIKDSFWILAGIRAPDRADYKKLAEVFGVKRGNIVAGSLDEILNDLGQEIGGVGPLSSRKNVKVIIDENLLNLGTVYCGMGRRDITLEIQLNDLINITNAHTILISKE